MFIVRRIPRDESHPILNHEPLHQPTDQNNLLRRCLTEKASDYGSEGNLTTHGPNRRWVSDRLGIRCDNGDVVYAMIAVDTYSHLIMGWTADTASFTPDSRRNLMLMCVERQFWRPQAPHDVEWLSVEGRANTSQETGVFTNCLGLLLRVPASPHTALKSSAESLAKTFLTDFSYPYGRSDAATVLSQLDHRFKAYKARARKA